MTASLVAAILILSAVGSLLWAQPSKSDRRRASMRQQAMQAGFSVTTVSVPDTSERGRIDGQTRLLTAYKKRVRGSTRPSLPELTVVRSTGESGMGLPYGWVWKDPTFRLRGAEQQRLSAALQALPDWVDCLVVLPDGVALCIEERDADNRIQALQRVFAETLQDLYEVISSNPV
ncbi:hypothetical protein E4656_04670 [Natronospirillum operosum]|uniref:Uncharacterized protein n=1 Tax=Natronospirillum operosum TaxID=2759953 RepID=A0A4Z0WAM9_9GAMM|nr:hypothetical protein [Natronospirillum operosum]TGG95709.1 hypothetical protein E4656_04670 [Natronospirillum operosum]